MDLWHQTYFLQETLGENRFARHFVLMCTGPSRTNGPFNDFLQKCSCFIAFALQNKLHFYAGDFVRNWEHHCFPRHFVLMCKGGLGLQTILFRNVCVFYNVRVPNEIAFWMPFLSHALLALDTFFPHLELKCHLMPEPSGEAGSITIFPGTLA